MVPRLVLPTETQPRLLRLPLAVRRRLGRLVLQQPREMLLIALPVQELFRIWSFLLLSPSWPLLLLLSLSARCSSKASKHLSQLHSTHTHTPLLHAQHPFRFTKKT